MASTVLVAASDSGDTPTLKLFSGHDSDTILNGSGDTGTEQTNNLGVWTFTVTEAITGNVVGVLVDSNGELIRNGLRWSDLADDTSTYVEQGLEYQVASMAGTIQTLDGLDTAQDAQHSTTQSAISGLNDFDPANDPVAEVTTVSGSVGSIDGITFPTNFGSLAIDGSGQTTVGAFATSLDLTATMKASVNSEADTAIGDYDAPTRAELTSDFNSVLARLGVPAGASVSADIAAAKSVVDAIVINTDELQTDWADGGRLDLILDSRASQTSLNSVASDVSAILVDTDTTIPGTLATIATYIDTEVAAIKNVTDQLPDGGALTSLATAAALATVGGVADAIQAKTDNLPASPAATSDIPTAAQNRAEIDSNSTQLAAIVEDTGTTLPGQISGLNNISTGDVLTQATAALTTYDPPTKGELDSGLAALNDITAAAVLAAGDVDGYTLEEALKLILASIAGKLSGAATTSITIRSADDSKARITATVDADGNRTALTLDAAG